VEHLAFGVVGEARLEVPLAARLVVGKAKRLESSTSASSLRYRSVDVFPESTVARSPM
jgi:hypothetical protein